MRLEKQERDILRSAILAFDPQAEIFLFGSRTDLNKRGGDIDLLVLSQRLTSMDKAPILVKIFETIEEQKIDLLIAKDLSDPFVQIAYQTGIRL
jgi:predicted nucleotidyltransferase